VAGFFSSLDIFLDGKVPINGSQLSRHAKIVQMAQQKPRLPLSRYEVSSEYKLTARQYGEVVLPDESTGQGPGTLAKKLSRCKEGMARVFAVMVQILLRTGAIAVQV
jgi:hypothetical protein